MQIGFAIQPRRVINSCPLHRQKSVFLLRPSEPRGAYPIGRNHGPSDPQDPQLAGRLLRCYHGPEALYGWHLFRSVSTMPARIYKPSKTAMQSGFANTKAWVLDFEPEAPRRVEPLMGWTSSGDMKQQLTIHFDTKEEAIAYCERKGIPYQVIEPKASAHRQIAYADNFSFRRGEPWTH